jgi:hypothetical protein
LKNKSCGKGTTTDKLEWIEVRMRIENEDENGGRLPPMMPMNPT